MRLVPSPYPEPGADPYEVLGVAQTATTAEVTAAYRKRHQGLSMNDPLWQRVQESKQQLTKAEARAEADLRHLSRTGALDALRKELDGA